MSFSDSATEGKSDIGSFIRDFHDRHILGAHA